MEDIRIETYKEIEDRDIKIDREYYEKLKTINYSDVETTLEKTLEKYIKESREPIYIGAKDIALLLVILQDPILYKKLLSKEDSNLSYDIKWAKYIIFEEDNGGDFIPYVNPLINKFGKDELLAFVLFSSNYLDYNDKKVIFEGSTKLYLNLLDIKNNDKILILEDKDLDSSFLIESSFKNSNITIYSNKKSSDIDISLIPEVYNNIELELLTDERGRPKSNFEYLKARVEQKEKLDKILLAPSLTFEYSKNDEEKYRNMIQNDFNFQNEILEKTSLEWLFNLLTINHLKDDGRALSVVKINTLSNPKNKNSSIVSVYASKEVKFHVTNKNKVDELYSNLNFFNLLDEENYEKYNKNEFITREYTIDENEDLVISGLGYIEVKRGPLEVRLHLPKYVKVVVRKSISKDSNFEENIEEDDDFLW